jgi:hypothetical protein
MNNETEYEEILDCLDFPIFLGEIVIKTSAMRTLSYKIDKEDVCYLKLESTKNFERME